MDTIIMRLYEVIGIKDAQLKKKHEKQRSKTVDC